MADDHHYYDVVTLLCLVVTVVLLKGRITASTRLTAIGAVTSLVRDCPG